MRLAEQLLSAQPIGDGWIALEASRRDLAHAFRQLGYLFGAEVGTYKGAYAETLCTAIPGLRLMCIDPWAPQDDYLEQKNDAGVLERAFQEASQRLARFDAHLSRARSTAAATKYPNGSLDFVYIDGNHRHESVLADLESWTPKVRRGGIVAGHDFVTRPKRHIGVEQAVREFTAREAIDPWFVLQSPDDETPSWAWMKR